MKKHKKATNTISNISIEDSKNSTMPKSKNTISIRTPNDFKNNNKLINRFRCKISEYILLFSKAALINFALFISIYFIYKDLEVILVVYLVLGTGMILSSTISLLLHLSVGWYTKRKYNFNIKSYKVSLSELLVLLYFIWIASFPLVENISFTPIIKNVLAMTGFILLLLSYVCFCIFGVTIINKISIKGKYEKWFYFIPIFSYESYLSTLIKESVLEKDSDNQKMYKGKIVKAMNFANLTISCIISMAFIYFINPELTFAQNSNTLILLIISVIVARTIARSSEIIHAFFKDVIYALEEKDRNTDIKAEERVILAISSLLEITFLYAPVYLFLHILNPDNKSLAFKENIASLFYSFGITTYKSIDFLEKGKTASLFVVFQVITSMVLTIFTFARYIGDIKPSKS